MRVDGLNDLRDPEGLPRTPEEADELSVLWGICHAFGSSSNMDHIVPATIRWVRDALGAPEAPVRLSLQKGDRLEVVGSEGMEQVQDAEGSTFATRRSLVQTEKQPQVVALAEPSERSLAVLPLVSRGLVLGVVEVAAPRKRLETRWHTLEAVVSQVAILLRNLGSQKRLKQEINALEGSVDLVRDLLQAPTPEEAVRLSVELLCEQFEIPAAAWFLDVGRGTFHLLSTAGLDETMVAGLTDLGDIPSLDDEMPSDHLEKLMDAFRTAASCGSIETFVSDRVILLAGIEDEHQMTAVKAVGRLMFDALKNLANVRLAETRNRTLDAALGFAAHELKAPLTATKMLIDTLVYTQRVEQLMPALQRSSDELSELWTLVETLLEWAVGEPDLEIAPVSFSDLVSDCLDAVETEGSCDVDITIADDVKIPCDERRLSTAFTSVLRSSLKHGAPHPVEVEVSRDGDRVVMRVRDQGPPVPPENEDALFDPFLKDRSFSTRASKGLGLFVARKIIEAHGGKIGLERASKGMTLCVQLPVAADSAELAGSLVP